MVTAQRREQNMQSIPIAVSALSADQIETAQIQNIGDLGSRIPNLNITQQNGSTNHPLITLRGVSMTIDDPQVDSAVSLYIDGVYLARAAGSMFDLADIERIEVLRGPQGTVFGRNTTGGAVNFITRGPRGEFGFEQTLRAGNYGQFHSKTRFDTPEWNGLSASLTYVKTEYDGDVDNLTPGVRINVSQATMGLIPDTVSVDKFGAEDVDGILGALRYENDRLTVDYRFDYTGFRGSQRPNQVVGYNPGPFGDFARSIIEAQPALGGTSTVSTRALDGVALPLLGEDFQHNRGHSISALYEINDHWKIKNIASYRSFEKTTGGNSFDGNALIDPFGGTGDYFTLLTSYITYRQHQATEELQLLASYPRVDALAGFFGFRENGFAYTGLVPFQTYLNDAVPALDPAGLVNWGRAINKSRAVYAQGIFHVTDRVDLTVGGRNTWDDRQEIDYRPDPTGVSSQVDFTHFDWDIALQYKFTDAVMGYGKTSTGYLSGGTLGGQPFKPEEVQAYELGFKADLFDRRVRLNVAAFRSEFEDKQVMFFDGFVFLVNSGEALINGIEAELSAVPVDGLTLSASVGYQDIEYEDLLVPVSGGGFRDISDIATTPGVPDTTLSLGFDYEFPRVALGKPVIGVDSTWRSDFKTYLTPTGDPVVDDTMTTKAHWLLNARAGLVDIGAGGGTLEVALWGKNLTDERQPGFIADVGTVVGGIYMQPRTYGIDFRYRF